jgi:hypothetical protein
MPSIYVEQLLFDVRNLAKLAAHAVKMREAFEVVDGEPKAFRNHSHGALWILVGPTKTGRYLTLPLDPTEVDGVWRPRTGYDSSAKELRRYDSE